MKIIKVFTCFSCPNIDINDGGGHCAGFIQCLAFSIMLQDWDGPENFDVQSGIHPDCKLEEYEELQM